MTYHHILTTIVKTFNEPYKPDIVLCNTIPNVDKLMNEAFQYLFNKIVIYDELKSRDLYKNSKISKNIFNLYTSLQKRIHNNIIPLDLNYSEYKDVVLYHDNHMISYYLRAKQIYYTLAEDGINHFIKINRYFFNHLSPFSILRKLVIITFFNRYYNLVANDGTSKFVRCVELNKPIRMIFKKRTFILSKEKLFLSLSDEHKRLILKVFLNDKQITQICKIENLLLTEPLFVDNRVSSEVDQIKLYSEIINKYKNIVYSIKPHPRDITDYKFIFPNLYIIDKDIPIEIINFLPLKINIITTINSSSIDLIYNFNEKNILFEKYSL
jgi:hypothetical protein